MKRLSRRMWVLLGAIAVVAVAAVGSYAFFTIGGSGNGSAHVATPTALSFYNNPDPVDGLWPGIPTPVDVWVHNPNPGNIYIATVTGTVGSVSVACSLTPIPPIVVNGEVGPGDTKLATVNLVLPDLPTNQTGCDWYVIHWSS
jgi:hypothetical protein